MANGGNPLREAGLFALGALAGMMFTRIGSPMVAKAGGSARAAKGGADAFDELAADHKRVLEILEKAEGAEGPQRLKLFLHVKRELSQHALAEEDVIYPLVTDRLDAHDSARELYEAHGELKTLLAEIEEAIERGDDARYRERVRMLRENVRTHAADEETRWFPMLRQALDDAQRSVVTGKVDREKALLV
jgi:hemerythrin superfamily protein